MSQPHRPSFLSLTAPLIQAEPIIIPSDEINPRTFKLDELVEDAIVDDDAPLEGNQLIKERRSSSMSGPPLNLGPPVHGEGFRPRADSNLEY